MRRFWIVLVTVLIVAAGVSAPRALSVSASGHSHAVVAQKKCKKGQHRVHGTCKKKHAVAPTPVPTATEVLDFPHQVDAFLSRIHFSGSVLIASKGEVLVSKGYGMADREHSVMNTPQTQFVLGHIDKPFTAMAILLLQERGKLKVQDLICTYLSDCPDAWKQITIHEVLNQTSGIADIGDVPNAAAATTPESLISLFKNKPLQFSPGTGFYFSDPGFVILSVIIAKVSGVPYETFVQKNVFDPLQMANTGFLVDHVALPHGAFGYTATTRVTTPNLAFPNAAYGMYSSADDLSRWDEALGKGLLSESSWAAMFTPGKDITSYFSFPSAFSSVSVGYGWIIAKHAGHRLVFYDDRSESPVSYGFQSFNGRYLDDTITVIVLGNRPADENQNDIGVDLAAMVFARH